MRQGITFQAKTEALAQLETNLGARLNALGLSDLVEHHFDAQTSRLRICLSQSAFDRLTPSHNTIDLVQQNPEGLLAWEIWLAWLSSPVALIFDSWEDLESAERIRLNLCNNAKVTSLDFRTEDASRPETHWTYQEDRGYVLLPHADLIESLILATQPDRSGTTYAFSCYRATEYVILLSMAQEAKSHHPELYQILEQQWRTKAISSRRFHTSFLHELGDEQTPLPMNWYVPGDRVWFKNPNLLSSDVTGYEGSWVIYIGGGMFCNFWNHKRPYTLDRKCVELFHWQHGYRINKHGSAHIDEDIVTALTDQSMADPQKREEILSAMKRYRDPSGVYANGGCIDSTREMPRRVLPQHCEVVLS